MEKEMATHSSILLAWKRPWTEESGGLKSMGLHDWACVHKGGGRWVGSNKVVELKKKKTPWTKHNVLCNHMQKGGKKKYDLYLHNPKHHIANLHKTFYTMSIQSKQSEHRHTIWVCSNYVTEFSLALRIHTYGLAGPGFFFFFFLALDFLTLMFHLVWEAQLVFYRNLNTFLGLPVIFILVMI